MPARAITIALVDLTANRNALRGVDGVLRLANAGVSAFDLRLPLESDKDEWAALVDLAVWAWACGLEVYLHSWEGRFDGTASTADAAEGHRDAATVIRRILRLERDARARRVLADVAVVGRYSGNLERDLWRGRNGFANPRADDYLEAFFDTLEWREPHKWPVVDPEWLGGSQRGTVIAYVGFFDPDWHYQDSDFDHDGHQDDTIPVWLKPRVRPLFMIYQTAVADMLAVLKRALKVWPKQACSVFVSSGRIDKVNGQIGNDEDVIAFVRQADPLVTEVVFYIGFGAEGQLLIGHRGFPSLEVVVPRLIAE